MTDQLLGEIESLNIFLLRSIGAFDYNSFVLNPDNDRVELVITRRQLKLLQNAVSEWILWDELCGKNNNEK